MLEWTDREECVGENTNANRQICHWNLKEEKNNLENLGVDEKDNIKIFNKMG